MLVQCSVTSRDCGTSQIRGSAFTSPCCVASCRKDGGVLASKLIMVAAGRPALLVLLSGVADVTHAQVTTATSLTTSNYYDTTKGFAIITLNDAHVAPKTVYSAISVGGTYYDAACDTARTVSQTVTKWNQPSFIGNGASVPTAGAFNCGSSLTVPRTARTRGPVARAFPLAFPAPHRRCLTRRTARTATSTSCQSWCRVSWLVDKRSMGAGRHSRTHGAQSKIWARLLPSI